MKVRSYYARRTQLMCIINIRVSHTIKPHNFLASQAVDLMFQTLYLLKVNSCVLQFSNYRSYYSVDLQTHIKHSHTKPLTNAF